MYVSFSDTTGTGPASYLGTSDVTSLQFHFQVPSEYSDYVVTQFTYYFGVSSTNSAYWWDTGDDYYDDLREAGLAGSTENSIECHPCSSDFYLTIEIPSEALADFSDPVNESDNQHFQIQNCYTQLTSADATETIQAADLVLVDITANGTTDTSEADDATKELYDTTYDEGVAAQQNTGGLWYTSILYTEYSDGVYGDVTIGSTTDADSGNTYSTITSVNSLKVDYSDDPIELTQGDNYSEEYYLAEGYEDESEIRAAGLPLNSHKFTFDDFGFYPGSNVASDVTVKSISVTISVPDATNITRFMYGGGISVTPMSDADTEYYKVLAGIKDDEDGSIAANGGYWYNDIGNADYAKVLELEEAGTTVFPITVESGTNLTNQNLGTYFTVTWDVPDEVQPYVTTTLLNSISFQLWYMEDEGAATEYSAQIVGAVLTYEETETVATTETLQTKTVTLNESASVGSTVTMNYSDLLTAGSDYENIADVYAVSFDLSTDTDANQLIIGAGTSVTDAAGYDDNWYQLNNQFVSDMTGVEASLGLVYYEETTVNDREDADANATFVDAYDANGTSTWSYTWAMQPGIQQKVSTEQDTDNLQFAVYYGGLGTTEVSTYTIESVTLYYVADDTSNTNKMNLLEGDLTCTPSEITVEEGSSVEAYLSIPVVSAVSSKESAMTVELGEDGTTLTVSAAEGTAGKQYKITATTELGQTLTVTVYIVESTGTTTTTTDDDTDLGNTTTTTAATTTSTDDGDSTTASTTTNTGSTTTTTGAATTTGEDEEFIQTYGDVNLDGTVSLADSVLLNKAVAGVVTLNDYAKLNADVNDDTYVDGEDALILLKYQVNLISILPYTE